MIMRGLASTWPAIGKWTLSYLEENCGNYVVETALLKNGKPDLSPDKGVSLKYANLAQSLNNIKENKPNGSTYIATPLDTLPEAIRQDCGTPVYCANSPNLTSRIFIGAERMTTPTHQDLPDNIYVLIKGEKQIILFSPDENVYPYSRLSKLPNYARTDPHQPDYTTFPKFRHAQPYVGVLQDGDALFIPSMWHHMHNVQATIGMSFWWYRNWRAVLAQIVKAYSQIRKIGNQSASWQEH